MKSLMCLKTIIEIVPVVKDVVADAVDEVSASNEELLLEDLVLQVLPCVG